MPYSQRSLLPPILAAIYMSNGRHVYTVLHKPHLLRYTNIIFAPIIAAMRSTTDGCRWADTTVSCEEGTPPLYPYDPPNRPFP